MTDETTTTNTAAGHDDALAADAADEDILKADGDVEATSAADEALGVDRVTSRSSPPPRLAVLLGVATVVTLAALACWLGYRAYQEHRDAEQRAAYLQVGRQGALNLTTIDWQHADDDVQRILNGATGTFHDDFAKRSQPFVAVVKQAQSSSVGAITSAGLESSTPTDGQVLVAVSVTTTNVAAPQQDQRAWRMRISVQRVGDDVKVSNVEFVA